MTPKVSVIIPTYNRAPVLSRAIESVLNQSFKNFELILVDDGSTDATSEVIKNFKTTQIKVLKQDNKGVSAARNYGIRNSQAEWIAFLDSDDEWLPTKLEKQIDFTNKNPDLKILHTEEIWIRDGVRVNPMNKHRKAGGDLYSQSLKLCCISPSTVMIHKNIFDQFGLFREDFPVCEDYDLWLKITPQQKIGFIETALIIKYGGHEDQLSRKFRAMDYWRILAMQDRLSSKTLTIEQEKETLKEFNFKIKLLLKGYRKHQNFENYDEIFNLLRK